MDLPRVSVLATVLLIPLCSTSMDSQNSDGFHYTITILTGEDFFSGTDAQVYLIMYGGENGTLEGPKIWLRGGTFEIGSRDIFHPKLELMLSPLSHLKIGHDGGGTNPSWYLKKVIIYCEETGIKQFFSCNYWIYGEETFQPTKQRYVKTGDEEDSSETEDITVSYQPDPMTTLSRETTVTLSTARNTTRRTNAQSSKVPTTTLGISTKSTPTTTVTPKRIITHTKTPRITSRPAVKRPRVSPTHVDIRGSTSSDHDVISASGGDSSKRKKGSRVRGVYKATVTASTPESTVTPTQTSTLLTAIFSNSTSSIPKKIHRDSTSKKEKKHSSGKAKYLIDDNATSSNHATARTTILLICMLTVYTSILLW